MRSLLLTAFLTTTLLVMKAQNPAKMQATQQDSSMITQALENIYYKGIYEGNVDLLKNIYYREPYCSGT